MNTILKFSTLSLVLISALSSNSSFAASVPATCNFKNLVGGDVAAKEIKNDVRAAVEKLMTEKSVEFKNRQVDLTTKKTCTTVDYEGNPLPATQYTIRILTAVDGNQTAPFYSDVAYTSSGGNFEIRLPSYENAFLGNAADGTVVGDLDLPRTVELK